ncbi:MAG TPA: MOSC domain-containing protein [Gemmatimonadetes bacterium]|jgi:MOSC domain-containing protein YiiM|nr:MOSC domain-containing protein [Gemmatimonadota bacterium]
MGQLEAIWIKTAHGGVMQPVSEANAQENKGLVGDVSFGRSKRQVTLIEKEIFDVLGDRFSGSVKPEMRRANFMVTGIELKETVGRILSIGDLKVEIFGETKPCKIMDDGCQGLREALVDEWKGGVYGCVLNDAAVKVGDVISRDE